MRTRFTARPRLETMESRTLLSVTSPLPGATAIGPLHGPSAISAMQAVSLAGVTFAGKQLSTELTSSFFTGAKTFTMDLGVGDVTGGLTQVKTTLPAVTGKLVFTGPKHSTNKMDLNHFDGGTLKFSPIEGSAIKLKLTFPRGVSATGGTYFYEVTSATGLYTGTKGTGKVTFSKLFPSDPLRNSTGNEFSGSLTPN